MPGEASTRRLLLAIGVNVTGALALGRELASAKALSLNTRKTLTFYDPRFPKSRRLARALPDVSRLHTVQGDPSRLLAHIVSVGPQGRGLRLQGVTTESIPFCLELFARSHHAYLESRRLDRDLFAWSLA